MGAPVSPWTWTAADHQDRALTLTATFTPAAPYTLITVTLTRPAGCLYRWLYLGTGPDGTPDTAAVRFYVPPGGPVIAAAGVLAGFGLITLSDLQAAQITAGP